MQEHKVEVLDWARNLPDTYFILDTETTGLNPKKDKIVEIAIIDNDGHVLLDTLVNPEIPIPEDASDVHGILDVDVKDSPTIEELMPKIEGILSSAPVLVYNVLFDSQFLYEAGLDPIHTSFKCVMKQYAKFYGVWNDYKHDWTFQSLANALKQCKIEHIGKHRALDDCCGTYKLVRYLQQYEETEPDEFDELVAKWKQFQEHANLLKAEIDRRVMDERQYSSQHSGVKVSYNKGRRTYDYEGIVNHCKNDIDAFDDFVETYTEPKTNWKKAFDNLPVKVPKETIDGFTTTGKPSVSVKLT